MSKLLTIEQAAAVLGISPWTVRYHVKMGRLSRVKLGRRVLIEEAELERFVQECKQKA